MRGAFLSDRRGMSPLIATVLLMAFAVALGGMIMNLSLDLGGNDACEQVIVQTSQFCAGENQIQLRAFNTAASVRLEGIKIIVTDNGVESSLSVKDSALEPSSRTDIAIPFPITPTASAKVIGVVGSPSAPYACIEKPIVTADPLPPC